MRSYLENRISQLNNDVLDIERRMCHPKWRADIQALQIELAIVLNVRNDLEDCLRELERQQREGT